MKIRNVHSRRWVAPVESLGALLDTLAGPGDSLWPRDRWPPMRLSGPLGVGAQGGHGPVRYRVAEYVPGRKVLFEFDPERGLLRGFAGFHYFEVSEEGGQAVLRHVLEARCGIAGAARWLLLIRPLHDALIEDALDRVEIALTGQVARLAQWSRWVLAMRWLARRRTRRSPEE
jgi:hypothetical protein